MADIVNLRMARKRKARADNEVRAAQNRAAFGRPKAERDATAAEKSISERRLDGHRREDEN